MDYIAVMYPTTEQPAQTSRWPLPDTGRRIVIPGSTLHEMAREPLCQGCMPHGTGFYPQARGHRMARREPADDLLIYCVAGRGDARRGRQRARVQAGQVLLLPAGEPHFYQADPDEPWSIYWVHLGGREVPAYFRAIAGEQAPLVTEVGMHARLAEEFQRLMTAVTSAQTAHLVYAANQLRSLLALLALLRHQHPLRHATLDVPRVNYYLQQHLRERLDLETVATATSRLSRYHFIREYKRQTGRTPMQAYQHMKVSRACYLLDITDLSVAEIARELGYDDPFYFSRLFKRVMGMAPRDYRRERNQQ